MCAVSSYIWIYITNCMFVFSNFFIWLHLRGTMPFVSPQHQSSFIVLMGAYFMFALDC